MISTHTPLAGRDAANRRNCHIGRNFYSHAPRGARQPFHFVTGSSRNFYSHAPRGARHYDANLQLIQFLFLLTRPSRGATRIVGKMCFITVFLLTRPSRGATDRGRDKAAKRHNFYSHAPRGARQAYNKAGLDLGNFYSHAPRGARPYNIKNMGEWDEISTHTPLAGRDPYLAYQRAEIW